MERKLAGGHSSTSVTQHLKKCIGNLMSRIVEGCVVRERCQVQLMDRQRELQIGRHFANCHFSDDRDASTRAAR